MPAARYQPVFKATPNVGIMTFPKLMRWAPILSIWGIGAGAAVAMFASPIPLFQKDVLLKLPIISTYFADTTPDADKPF